MSNTKPERDIWQAKHIMIDVETLGSHPSQSPVLSIAAMRFNPLGCVSHSDLSQVNIMEDHINHAGNGIYYETLDLTSQLQFGRMIDIPTLAWWTNTAEKSAMLHRMLAYQETLVVQKIDLYMQLDALTTWVRETTNEAYTYCWAFGNTFDVAFVEQLYRERLKPWPFHYQGLMDARTLCNIYELTWKKNFQYEKDAQSHHALADVWKQIKYVQTTLARVWERKET